MSQNIPKPFETSYSPDLPELLRKIGCSIGLTTYQAGKLAILYAPSDTQLTLLPRTFDKPMGVSTHEDLMAIACRNEVIVLQNTPALAKNYPNKPNYYDAFYTPRSTHYTGYVDIHDIAFGNEGELWGVNTSFSCVCRLNGKYNFEPIWKPSFITELQPEDRCHLNGLVAVNGKPKYVTALGTGNTAQSWRDHITEGGVLIDIDTQEVLLDGLAMPHSPMLYKGELYLLLSATGQLAKVDLATNQLTVIKELDGFCRGLAIHNDYAFVGMSKLRQNSSTFAKLPFAEKAQTAGIKVIHLPTGALVGEMTFRMSIDEIYEVCVLPDMLTPNVLNTQNDIHRYGLSIPDQTYWTSAEAVEKTNLELNQ